MLPDINDVYPQLESVPIQRCENISCNTNLYDGDEVIESSGYYYFDRYCAFEQMIRNGEITKKIMEVRE